MSSTTDWFLTASERDNPATDLDRRHLTGDIWSVGNAVTPLVHGATYFAHLLAAVRATGDGDLVLFTDWRGDPDERLDGPETEISRVLCEAADRGVVVRGLLWRSHLDRLQFSERENWHLGQEIDEAGGRSRGRRRLRRRHRPVPQQEGRRTAPRGSAAAADSRRVRPQTTVARCPAAGAGPSGRRCGGGLQGAVAGPHPAESQSGPPDP